MATACSPLFVRQQQPTSNEDCISANCKKITYVLILPFFVLLLDALTIYNFSSISNTMLQTCAVFHVVKALILIILCGLFVYAGNHPEKRDILWAGGIITGLLAIISIIYMFCILYQCDSMGRCYECYKEGTQKCYSEECPDYSPSISKQCNSSINFPMFGAIANRCFICCFYWSYCSWTLAFFMD